MSVDQPPPKGLRAGGKRLWAAVTDALVLDEHERSLLIEAARVVDRCDALDRLVRREGSMLNGKAHPALVEARQQQQTMARLIASLRLPLDLQEPDRRPQRRGPRGTYYPRLIREENVV